MPLPRRRAISLENFSAAAKWLPELYDARNGLVMASVPVHRPPLICQNTGNALRNQSGQHCAAVEAGTALVLALLHDLIARRAQRYRFSETMTRE